ncbi:MAG: propanediol utilization protein [Boseongicola sp.]|nr:propanediol utilization protein [Boseongicola sp.]MDD9976977.1 propanediol utilization protein [Boseongicola sp.]
MARVAGHFGEWLQGRLGPDGPVVLVTLPCPRLSVSVVEGGPVNIPHSNAALQRFFDDLEISAPDLQGFGLALDMQLGSGCGASTASLLALAKWAGAVASADRLARACVAAEGASDPLMFDTPENLLWASRKGEIVDRLPSLPDYEIIGGFWGAPTQTDPGSDAFPDIEDLVAAWKQAKSLEEHAVLASQSASRLDAATRNPPPISDICRRLGAVGHIRAHTGNARGFVFHPGSVPDNWNETLIDAGFSDPLRFARAKA